VYRTTGTRRLIPAVTGIQTDGHIVWSIGLTLYLAAIDGRALLTDLELRLIGSIPTGLYISAGSLNAQLISCTGADLIPCQTACSIMISTDLKAVLIVDALRLSIG